MLSEGIHSVADSSNQALLLVGHRRGAKKADDLHPFGYGQERYFWALLVAVVLFAVGSLFSLREGWIRLRDPHEVRSLPWALGVLGIALLLEGYSLARAVKAANIERTGSWWRYIRRTKDPENAVVLLEDAAAEVGLLIALAGVLAAHFLHEPRFDAVGSVGIGLVLGFVSITAAVEMRSLLVGESAGYDEVREIESALVTQPCVRRIVKLKTMHLGPDKLLVTARVEFDRGLQSHELTRVVDEAEAAVSRRLDLECEVYLVPEPPNEPADAATAREMQS